MNIKGGEAQGASFTQTVQSGDANATAGVSLSNQGVAIPVGVGYGWDLGAGAKIGVSAGVSTKLGVETSKGNPSFLDGSITRFTLQVVPTTALNAKLGSVGASVSIEGTTLLDKKTPILRLEYYRHAYEADELLEQEIKEGL